MLKKVAKKIIAIKNLATSIIKKDISSVDAQKILSDYYPDPDTSCWIEERNYTKFGGGVLLSIILPVYNNEKYIRSAIDSVLIQSTAYSYELIIVDDGSTDKSGQIVKSYSEIPNVILITQENKGFSGARNSGLDEAHGDYIMFLDSDDELLPGAIDKLMSVAISKNADVVAGGYVTVSKNGQIKQGTKFSNAEVTPMGNLYGMPWGKVYKRELFKNLKFPENYWFEDSIFAQIVWPMCRKCYTISDNVYRYLLNPNGISHTSKRSKKSIDSLYITEKLFYEKQKFGLNITQEDFEYFLRMVRLTYKRTQRLKDKFKRCIFVGQVAMFEKYFIGFTANRSYKKLEDALRNKSFRKYVYFVELL